MKQKTKTKSFTSVENAVKFLIKEKISRNSLINSYWKNKKYVIKYIEKSN